METLNAVLSVTDNMSRPLRAISNALSLVIENMASLDGAELPADEAEALRKAAEALDESVTELEESVAGAAAQIEGQNEAMRAGAAQAAKFSEAIEEAGESLEALPAQAPDEVADSMEQLNRSARLGNLMEAAEVVGGVGEKLMDLGSSAMEAAETVAGAEVKIKNSLGLTDEATENMVTHARALLRDGYGGSLDEVSDAIIEVSENLKGVDDSNIEDLTKKAVTLAQTMGMDMGETLRGVDGLMTGFGISANEAFDLMVTGAQRGLNQTDELGDNIAEYAARWGEAGMSASTYFSMLQAGLDNGAYSLDKIGDFLNEFLTSLDDGRMDEAIGGLSQNSQDLFQAYKDGGATAEDVLRAVTGELGNMENASQRATIASELWSSLGEDNALGMITALSGVTDSYGDVAGAAATAEADNSSAVASMKGAWEDLKLSFEPFGTALANVATNILDSVTPLVQGAADAFNSLSQPAQTAVASVVALGVGLAILIPAVTGVVTAVSTLSGALGITTLVTKAATALQSMGGVIGVVKTAFTALSAVFAANPIGVVVTALFALGAAFKLAYDNCEWFRDKVNAAVSAVVDGFDQAKANISAICSTFKADFERITGDIAAWWSDLSQRAAAWPAEALAWGSDVIQGFKDGLNQKIEDVRAWFDEKFGWIVEKVRSIFDIHSPSKVFEDIGGNLISGFKSGMESIWSGVESWVSDKFGWVVDKVKNLFGGEKEEGPEIDFSAAVTEAEAQMARLEEVVSGAMARIETRAATASSNVAAVMATGFSAIRGEAATVSPAVSDALSALPATVGSVFGEARAAAKEQMAALTADMLSLTAKLTEGSVKALGELVSGFAAVFGQLTQAAGAGMRAVGEAATGAVKETSEAVLASFSDMAAGMVATVRSAAAGTLAQMTGLKEALTTLMEGLRGNLLALWGRIRQEAEAALEALRVSGTAKIKAFCDAVTAQVNTLPPAFKAAGVAMIEDLAAGISSREKMVLDTTSDLVEKLKKTFTEGMGIHSPSRFMTWVGEMMAEGIINGWSGSQVESFYKNTIEMMKESFKNGKFNADELVNFLDDESILTLIGKVADVDVSNVPDSVGIPAIIQAAQQYLGYVSGSHDHSIFGQRFGTDGAWCAYFVRAMAEDAGVPFPASGYVPAIKDWAIQNGRWTQTPQAGYAVIFDWSGQGNGTHIGLVESVGQGGNVITIEGNTTGDTKGSPVGVYRKDRNSHILGYVALDGGGGVGAAGGYTLAAAIQAAYNKKHGIVTIGTGAGYFGGGMMAYPLAGGPYGFTSYFGKRPYPGAGGSENHGGVDIGAPAGVPILAALAGSVSYAGYNDGYGNEVTLDHGGGLQTLYGHMSRILTGAGQSVAQGQQIGLVGSTGNSTGPHLHFEVRINGAKTDPYPYLTGQAVAAIGTPPTQAPGAVGTAIPDTTGSGLLPYNFDISEGSAQWSAMVQQALAMLGEPVSLTKGVLWAIEHESSGNPNDVNTWDSNAARGTPSKGLLQMIEPTFKEYALPGYNQNVTDPLSNILAALNYMKGRYGSIQNVINTRISEGRWRGYATGTNSATPGYHWVGEEGPELMRFMGGERVIPHEASVVLTSSPVAEAAPIGYADGARAGQAVTDTQSVRETKVAPVSLTVNPTINNNNEMKMTLGELERLLARMLTEAVASQPEGVHAY